MKLKLNHLTVNASMIFRCHPDKFDVWKKNGEALRILNRAGKPLATIAPYKEFMSNHVVKNEFLKGLKDYGFPWIPTRIACNHGVAAWHDASDTVMIDEYKIKLTPFEDTLYDATEALSTGALSQALPKKRIAPSAPPQTRKRNGSVIRSHNYKDGKFAVYKMPMKGKEDKFKMWCAFYVRKPGANRSICIDFGYTHDVHEDDILHVARCLKQRAEVLIENMMDLKIDPKSFECVRTYIDGINALQKVKVKQKTYNAHYLTNEHMVQNATPTYGDTHV